ncbi:MAG: DNA polymerase III subunit chi [Marinagarivorans sp.]|nr:DNA polymerase III subunit chi [Marinagarivorans sp.]
MARIDFYILQSASWEARLHFAAKLCHKALQNNLSTLVWLDNRDYAAQLDELLWHSPPESYLPHTLAPAAEPPTPILISVEQDQPQYRQLLIQLSESPHPQWQSFERCAEIVIQTPEVLNITRQRYRDYSAKGSSPLMHNL